MLSQDLKKKPQNPKSVVNAFLDDEGHVIKILSSKKDWKGLQLESKKSSNLVNINTVTDAQTGEVLSQTVENNKGGKESEPPFIKLYFSDIAKLEDLPKGHDALLYELFKRTTYDNLVILNAVVKNMIASAINVKPRTIDKYLTTLVDREILFRAGRGTYVFNPNIAARGKWKEVKKLRLSIEYSVNAHGEVEKDISCESVADEVAVTEK